MLKDQIYKDMTTALKSGDKLKNEALKMIKAEILKHETSGENMVTDDEVVKQILKRSIKQRKEAAEGFEKGGNTEMAKKELQEAEIYQAYLPAQMGEAEVKTIVEQTIAELGAASPSEMGKVMAAVMPKLKDKADGSLINKLVRELLNQSKG